MKSFLIKGHAAMCLRALPSILCLCVLVSKSVSGCPMQEHQQNLAAESFSQSPKSISMDQHPLQKQSVFCGPCHPYYPVECLGINGLDSRSLEHRSDAKQACFEVLRHETEATQLDGNAAHFYTEIDHTHLCQGDDSKASSRKASVYIRRQTPGVDAFCLMLSWCHHRSGMFVFNRSKMEALNSPRLVA